MVNDSGYPAAFMPDVERLLPKQNISVIPAGAGVAVMKEEYGRSLQILLAVCGTVLFDRVRQRRQFAARPRRQPARPDRRPPCHRRDPARNHHRRL